MTWPLAVLLMVLAVCATGLAGLALWLVHDSEPIEITEHEG